MVLAGRPKDCTYPADLAALERAMEDARGKLGFRKGTQDHRRGRYPHISTGISYGGGSKVKPSSPRAVHLPLLTFHQFSRFQETSV